MRTSREAAFNWSAVELSFLVATLQVSTHAPSTCTDIPPRAGSGRGGPAGRSPARQRRAAESSRSYRAPGGGLQGWPGGTSGPLAVRRVVLEQLARSRRAEGSSAVTPTPCATRRAGPRGSCAAPGNQGQLRPPEQQQGHHGQRRGVERGDVEEEGGEGLREQQRRQQPDRDPAAGEADGAADDQPHDVARLATPWRGAGRSRGSAGTWPPR